MRANNESQFLQELNFGLHLKSESYIALRLTNNDPEALGMALRKGLTENFRGIVLVELPMVSNKAVRSAYFKNIEDDDDEEEDQWKIWNKFHEATGYHTQVQVALVMTSDLPSNEELKRWLGEYVGMLIIPHTTFMTNNSNYPVLSRPHQQVLAMFIQYNKDCQISIEPRGLDDHRTRNYGEYVNFLINNKVDMKSDSSMDDSTRYPLQPLKDNLDTTTYEVFEMDPAKYILYQRAIEAAMRDKIAEAEKETKRLVLVVLGAGRGPLIRAALNACKNTQRKLKILVVEKNPNAIVTLTNLISVMWPNEDITLISKDMRKLTLNEKADIIVSELLGSFGDNELSPECLDGAQHLLKNDGVSIPYNSISYLRPVMTTKIHNLLEDGQMRKKRSSQFSDKKYAICSEVNWLVKFCSVYYIDKSKEVFRFVHPNHDKPIDNSRYTKLHFKSNIDCILHGFSGYFTAQLYKDIEISILPEVHTQGMASWFPIFFPVERRYINKGERISIEMWRKVGPDKVWYEWRAQDGIIANEGGENHPILL